MHAIGVGIEWAAVVLLAVAVRVAFLHFKPYRTCRWCRPGGLVGGSWAAAAAGHDRRRRPRYCWRCRGTRVTRRWGAWHVHKAKLSLLQAWEERGTD